MRLISAVLLVAIGGLGNADTLNSERPGFSSGPLTLDRGRLQLEMGYQYDDLGSADAHTLPLTLVRAGFGEGGLELQFGWGGYTRIDGGGREIDGISDASVALKVPLPIAADSRWNLGGLIGTSVPIGDSRLTSDSFDPLLGLFWTYAPEDGPAPFGTFLLTAADELVLAPAVGVSFSHSARLGSYLEYFGVFAESGGSSHSVNGGVTWLANDDLQFDAEIGFGLNDRAPDFFFGTGFSRRW